VYYSEIETFSAGHEMWSEEEQGKIMISYKIERNTETNA